MSNKQSRELRTLDTPELHRRLQDAKNELINLRFGLATRQTENTARVSATRRQIARILTVLSEREQEA
ncbi:MAG TPA: 50S ribosomal protein L29 [Chloroflexota bacterium]|nr:50S ribosomal protein L29 [Chloroflexota bacterium]